MSWQGIYFMTGYIGAMLIHHFSGFEMALVWSIIWTGYIIADTMERHLTVSIRK